MMLAKALASASASAPKVYVEDVFSTWLYTGNGSTQTITNGIDLSGKGGLVWLKERGAGGTGSDSHSLYDTARTRSSVIYTNSTSAAQSPSSTQGLTAFTGSGFTVGTNYASDNRNTVPIASWTFRKAAKFFDVVTYTGNGSNRTVAHSLSSVPGCIMVKRTDTGGYPWYVYHRSLTNQQLLLLDSTSSVFSSQQAWNYTDPTSTVFSVGNDAAVNANGGTYVAYLFAHDAGGFGYSGNDSVVKCGSYTTPSVGGVVDVNLGWEPQWILFKSSSNTGSWYIIDNMRGWSVGSADQLLIPNNANEEASVDYGHPTATGFTTAGLNSSQTYIYIAIRRGPMKTPTDATSIFNTYQTSTSRLIGDKYDSNLYPPDLYIWFKQSAGGGAWWQDRLRGWKSLTSRGTDAELGTTYIKQSGKQDELEYIGNWDNATGYANWYFRRAPGFFDVVAYTGTGSSLQIVDHGLGVKPQFYTIKCRSNATTDWYVWVQTSTSPSPNGTWTLVKLASGAATYSGLTGIGTTSTYFETYWDGGENSASGRTYIAYLFATCPGVSKVGSYTGTGTTLNIDCGFTNGARFVLIKRTDSTGDWYVWDTARGIVSGNDPYLLLNFTAAEITNTDYIDPLSSGFQISSTAPADINANGGSFIFLAVA